MNGLILQNGITINANWKDRMVIDRVPVAVAATTPTATTVGGGSLIQPATYYYKITAIGVNGESLPSAEVNATTSAGNQTIDLTWDAQELVEEYHVYRGTATGVYDGYFRVFNNTGTFADDGTFDMVTSHSHQPPTVNGVLGEPVGGHYTGTNLAGLRSVVFFSEITTHMYTYQDKVDDGVDIIPQMSIIHLKKGDKVIANINLDEVIYPNWWNTPGSDDGCHDAITQIQNWATTP